MDTHDGQLLIQHADVAASPLPVQADEGIYLFVRSQNVIGIPSRPHLACMDANDTLREAGASIVRLAEPDDVHLQFSHLDWSDGYLGREAFLWIEVGVRMNAQELIELLRIATREIEKHRDVRVVSVVCIGDRRNVNTGILQVVDSVPDGAHHTEM